MNVSKGKPIRHWKFGQVNHMADAADAADAADYVGFTLYGLKI